MEEVVLVEALMEVLAEDEVGSMVVGGEDTMAMEEGEVAMKADEEEVVKEGEDSAEVEEEAAIRGEEEEVARALEGSRGTRGNPVPTRSDGLRGEEGVAIEKYITSLNLRISKHVGALRHLKRVWCENLYPQFVEYTIHSLMIKENTLTAMHHKYIAIFLFLLYIKYYTRRPACHMKLIAFFSQQIFIL